MPGGWETYKVEVGGRTGRRNYKGHKETFGSHGYIHYIDCDDSFTGIQMSKLIKLYMLNMCGVLYVSYTSIKLLNFFNEKATQGLLLLER